MIFLRVMVSFVYMSFIIGLAAGLSRQKIA